MTATIGLAPYLSLVPAPLLDPATCPHRHTEGPPDKCMDCGIPIRWEERPGGGWRPVAVEAPR